jgi:hypothetical protein
VAGAKALDATEAAPRAFSFSAQRFSAQRFSCELQSIFTPAAFDQSAPMFQIAHVRQPHRPNQNGLITYEVTP